MSRSLQVKDPHCIGVYMKTILLFVPIHWGVRGFKHYRQQSMVKCISLNFYFRGLSGPQNQRNLEPHN
jgi:hypothetical protein